MWRKISGWVEVEDRKEKRFSTTENILRRHQQLCGLCISWAAYNLMFFLYESGSSWDKEISVLDLLQTLFFSSRLWRSQPCPHWGWGCFPSHSNWPAGDLGAASLHGDSSAGFCKPWSAAMPSPPCPGALRRRQAPSSPEQGPLSELSAPHSQCLQLRPGSPSSHLPAHRQGSPPQRHPISHWCFHHEKPAFIFLRNRCESTFQDTVSQWSLKTTPWAATLWRI